MTASDARDMVIEAEKDRAANIQLARDSVDGAIKRACNNRERFVVLPFVCEAVVISLGFDGFRVERIGEDNGENDTKISW